MQIYDQPNSDVYGNVPDVGDFVSIRAVPPIRMEHDVRAAGHPNAIGSKGWVFLRMLGAAGVIYEPTPGVFARGLFNPDGLTRIAPPANANEFREHY